MKYNLHYMTVILFLFGCKPSELKNAKEVDLRYCQNCILLGDAYQFEENLGSEKLDLTYQEIQSYAGRMVTYVFYPDAEILWDKNRTLFKRKALLRGFSEYILYDYSVNFDDDYIDSDTTIVDAGMIDFNLGNTPLGFTKDTSSTPGEIYMKKPVNPISLIDFKDGYYSILKWLYSLETDKRKVIKERKEYFDHDYYSSPEVKLTDMVFENSWQEDFLFYKYSLVGDDKYSYIVSVEPGTYAPLILYEEQTHDNSPYYGKYHINISDMAIRIRLTNDFTGIPHITP